MKLITLLAALTLPVAALDAQQTPPTPPTRPTRPPRIAPVAPMPAPIPRALPDLGFDIPDLPDLDFLPDLQDLRMNAMAMADQAREQARFWADNANIQRFQDQAQRAAQMALANTDFSEDRFARPPRAPWAQGDPADSLYRLARQAFNDGDWRHASELFHDVVSKFPKSAYAADCAYYEAFSRYRIGTTPELQNALTLLSNQGGATTSRRSMQTDVATLAARIRGALAARGDQQAAAQIAQDAQKPSGCDREDLSVKAEALNALGQMDPAAVTPLLQQVLMRKDTCSAQLKQSALFLLMRRGDTTATQTLTAVATDSHQDLDLRSTAISYLGRMNNPTAINTLKSLVAPGNDEEVQRAAIGALSRIGGPENRQFLLGLVANPALSSEMRGTAIAYVGRDTTVTVAELSKLFDTSDSRNLRSQIIGVLGRRSDTQAADKLMDIVRTSTDPSARREALSYLSRRNNDPRVKKFLVDLVGK